MTAIAVSASPAGAADGGPATAVVEPAAVIRVLDKITARVQVVKAPIDRPVSFGALQIVVRTCDKRPPEETPESAAFLEIDEVRTGEQRTRVFTGWMFASSPGLSALEHPIYDIWVVDCVSSEDSSAASAGAGKSE